MNNSNESTVPVDLPRCPFVGLHDDPDTCLAYPSFWNYCYRVKPPASVDVSHQTSACLTRDFVRCPVYLSPAKTALPPSLRGAVPLRRRRSLVMGFAIFGLLILFVITIVLLDRSLGRGKLLDAFDVDRNAAASPIAEARSSNTLPPFMAPENPVTDTPANGLPPITSGTRPPTEPPTLIPSSVLAIQTAGLNFSPAPEATDTMTPTSLPAGVCGHLLDVPFGSEVRFVLHRVRSGENLSMYADQHHTSPEAILAVNYRLPVPVWEHWILVIPLDTTLVTDVPPFEPYQALEARLSLAELARNLSADPAALQQYNAFDESCTVFSGWILVPREADPRQGGFSSTRS